MIEIKQIGARLVVSGNSLEILKLKSSVSSRLPIDLVKSEGRSQFSIPVESAAIVLDLFPNSGPDAELTHKLGAEASIHEQARSRCLKIIEEEIESVPLSPWDTILDHAQTVAFNAMTQQGLKGLCLFDEQGIGKTVMTIASMDALKELGEIDSIIIISPKSMINEWKKEIERFVPGKYSVTVIEGDSGTRFKQILKPTDIAVVNFESIDSLQVVLKGKASSSNTLLIVDESYYVKNRDAKRSAAVRSLRSCCKKCFVLCGTPAPNNAIDLVHQFDTADDGYTFAGFRSTGDISKDRSQIEDKMRSRGVFIRRLKSDVLPDLPEKNFSVVPVALIGRQHDLYVNAVDQLVLWLKGMDNKTFHRNLTGYFQKRQTLLQICSCPSEIDPLFTETHAKLSALDGLVEQVVSQEKRKVVIWSYYTRSVDEIVERYAKHGVVRVDGSTKGNDRRQAIEVFQKDQGIKVFVGNPAAAGAGITLHAAADAIYFSYPPQAAHYLQSLDRIHRRGQSSKSVRFNLLVCKGTIEEQELTRLRQKELEQHSLLGDDAVWPSSLDDALAELTGHVS